jgi:hypothetical protein
LLSLPNRHSFNARAWPVAPQRMTSRMPIDRLRPVRECPELMALSRHAIAE